MWATTIQVLWRGEKSNLAGARNQATRLVLLTPSSRCAALASTHPTRRLAPCDLLSMLTDDCISSVFSHLNLATLLLRAHPTCRRFANIAERAFEVDRSCLNELPSMCSSITAQSFSFSLLSTDHASILSITLLNHCWIFSLSLSLLNLAIIFQIVT